MKKLIVFTDLDGSLLDHNHYDWQAAKPAIEKLHSLNYPLIFNSSKTYAEMLYLSKQMNNHHPFIFENGSSIALPKNYFSSQTEIQEEIIHFGTSYKNIIKILSKLRKQYNYNFIGFNDTGIEDIVSMTNLSNSGAAMAKQRHSSEPIKWLDSDSAFNEFCQHLKAHQLSIVKGGRFHSVMGHCNKGEAISWLLTQYTEKEPETDWLTTALGDSQNDISMLQRVTYPVLIKNPAVNVADTEKINNLITTKQPGPEGWNTAVLGLITLIQ